MMQLQKEPEVTIKKFIVCSSNVFGICSHSVQDGCVPDTLLQAMRRQLHSEHIAHLGYIFKARKIGNKNWDFLCLDTYLNFQ